MKTTFDLPEPLLREAKSVAAKQGRPLRDLVAEALAEKLALAGRGKSPSRGRLSEWKAFFRGAVGIKKRSGNCLNLFTLRLNRCVNLCKIHLVLLREPHAKLC